MTNVRLVHVLVFVIVKEGRHPRYQLLKTAKLRIFVFVLSFELQFLI